jgi:protease-4
MEPTRESIFFAGLRTLCRTFFGGIGVIAAFFLFACFYAAISPSSAIPDKTTLEILPDASGKRESLASTTPVILQIPIHGIIGDPRKLDTSTLESILLDSQRGPLANGRVKAILLCINSPGGTVVDSDNIYRMLLEYKAKYNTPIFAYVDGLCASGGMYIASAASEVFAGPASIIGSIGVRIGPFFNIYDAMEKVGIKAKTLTEGIDKDMLNPTRPWLPGEESSLQATLAFSYNRFVDIVSSARPNLDKDRLIREYGAQVYDPVTAEKIGYVEHSMSSRNEALLALLNRAGLDPSKPYQVVALNHKQDWLSDVVSKSPLIRGEIEHKFNFGQMPIQEAISYLYIP